MRGFVGAFPEIFGEHDGIVAVPDVGNPAEHYSHDSAAAQLVIKFGAIEGAPNFAWRSVRMLGVDDNRLNKFEGCEWGNCGGELLADWLFQRLWQDLEKRPLELKPTCCCVCLSALCVTTSLE